MDNLSLLCTCESVCVQSLKSNELWSVDRQRRRAVGWKILVMEEIRGIKDRDANALTDTRSETEGRLKNPRMKEIRENKECGYCEPGRRLEW